MTDRKLLEMAAKAADMDIGFDLPRATGKVPLDWDTGSPWDPLTDDGDALRLAVKLGISVLIFPAAIGTRWPQNGLPSKLIGTDSPYEDISAGQDKGAATRRAIVRAAAEIGSKT